MPLSSKQNLLQLAEGLLTRDENRLVIGGVSPLARLIYDLTAVDNKRSRLSLVFPFTHIYEFIPYIYK